MSNISIKLNLRQLKSAVRTMKGKSGDIRCLVIPIEENCLFEGEKGIYLDLQAYQLREKLADRKDTHLIKQSFPKSIYDVMPEEDRKHLPIIGNAILWSGSEPEPNNTDIGVSDESENDLPF